METDLDLKTVEHKSLKNLNTFGVDISARYYLKIEQIGQVEQLLEDFPVDERKMLILGGGSNILFVGNYEGWVLHNAIQGIEVVEEDASQVKVRVGAGMNWHKFVRYCVDREWGGIENLALIPGTVGAAPIQNIGAYGVELKDVFDSLRAVDLKEKTRVNFNSDECKFNYRDSVFKRSRKQRYLIADITLQLSKKGKRETSYKSLDSYLKEQRITDPAIKDIFDAVVDIRQRKLPDPGDLGNAGSFFKNPIIAADQFNNLKQEFPGIPHYQLSNEKVKVPAAWLIDQAGWKGVREGDVGTYPKQALVIVNYGSATGAEILNFASKIRRSVYNTFGVKLEPEVNIITSGDQDWKKLLFA